MSPTYAHGEILLTEKVNNYFPSRFDVVVINDSEEKEFITKRVLGLPGENLKMVNGKIYINNKILNDYYYREFNHPDEQVYKIPHNCVWVIGDNRDESLYGIFLMKEVEGLVW